MRPIFQGWNNYSQLSFYFPILPIFKENLNRQGMALKPPRGDLVKMAFKVFNNQDKARYQQKAQLLAAALRLPPPTSRWARQQHIPSGPRFKCNQTRHWAKNCPSPCPQARTLSTMWPE
jgi:hypothetical protein